MAYSTEFLNSLLYPVGDLPKAHSRTIVPPGTMWGTYHAEPHEDVYIRGLKDMEAQRVLAYETSRLDLFQALERHRKTEDAKQSLEDILSLAKVCLKEGQSIDLGGSVKLIGIAKDELNRCISMYIEDPLGEVRYLKIEEEELKGCKDITEVVIRALSREVSSEERV